MIKIAHRHGVYPGSLRVASDKFSRRGAVKTLTERIKDAIIANPKTPLTDIAKELGASRGHVSFVKNNLRKRLSAQESD